jgi:ABC-type multidrug transport system fused ATPase/permease subunit
MKQLHATWKLLNSAERRAFIRLSAGDALVQLLDISFLAGLLWLVHGLLKPASAPVLPLSPPWILCLFFAGFLAKNVAGYRTTRALHAFAGRVALRLSGQQLDACQGALQADFIEAGSPLWIRKVNFHPLEFAHYLLLGFQQIGTQLLLISVSVGAIFLYDPSLFLLLLLVLLPPAFFLFRSIRRGIDRRKHAIKQGNEASLQYLLEALTGQPEAKVYGRRDFFRQRFLGARKRFSEAYFDLMGLQQLPARALESVAVLGIFLLLAFALQSRDAGVYFLMRAGAFMAAAYKMIPGMVKMIGAAGQLRAWSHTLDVAPPPEDLPTAVAEINLVEAVNLGFHYGANRLFHGLSFSLQRGELVVLEGASGAGKTTLMQLLLGFLEPAAGSIRINGSVLSLTTAAAFWPRIAYVRQQSFLIHDSIARNITLEEEPQHPERLQAVLRATGLAQMLAASGADADKQVLEKGGNLSGGQQQRIALARALYRDADLYLLDEPFNELDGASVRRLQQLLVAEAAAGKIILVITHQPDMLPAARRIRINHETQAQYTGPDHSRLRSVGSG